MNRCEFASSKAASTSSKIIKGGGLLAIIAQIKAIEIKAFSPPERALIFFKR